MKSQAVNVVHFSPPAPVRRYKADFVYEAVAAGWPPTRECREVTDEHRIRKSGGRVVCLDSIRSRKAPVSVPD